MSGNGHVCPTCGSWVGPGMGHVCNFPTPMQPMNPACRAPWRPLTLEDIRKVIREELDRKPTPDSARRCRCLK